MHTLRPDASGHTYAHGIRSATHNRRATLPRRRRTILALCYIEPTPIVASRPMLQHLGFRGDGSFSRSCKLDAGSAFGWGRHEYDMVSQYGTREGESIRLALPKEPPTKYDMALQRDATEGGHTGEHIRKGCRKVRSLYGLALKELFDGMVGAVCGGKWGKEG